MQWLIDGHNLIGQMPNLRLDDPNDEEKLLEELRRFRAKSGDQITVVFDAGQTYQPGTMIKRGGITIQFAPHGQTADAVIKRRLQKIKNPQATIVVTSDRAVQQAARHVQVRAITAQEFIQKRLHNHAMIDGDEGSQTDVRLSSNEIDEWLDIFGQ